MLGRWPIAPENVEAYGDVLVAVFENIVVAVYDITGHTRNAEKKVTFTGTPSTTWAHLVDQPNPGKHWGRQGDAWPVRLVDTAVASSPATSRSSRPRRAGGPSSTTS